MLLSFNRFHDPTRLRTEQPKNPKITALPSRYAVSSVQGSTDDEISFTTLTGTVVFSVLGFKLGISCVVVATFSDGST